MNRRAAILAVVLAVGLGGWFAFRLTTSPIPSLPSESASTPQAHGPEVQPTNAPVRTEAESIAREPQLDLTRIETLDESGNALDGVALLAAADEQAVPMGISELGTLLVLLKSNTKLTARRSGFEDANVQIGDVVPKEVRIVLSKGPSLTGIVLLPNGAPAGAGIHVVAWGDVEGRAATSSALRAWNEHEAPELYAATDQQGRFSIRVRDSTAAYTLTAGGQGYMPLDELRGARPGAEGLEIVVHRVFAARIELVDELNIDLHLPEDLWVQPGALQPRYLDTELSPHYLVHNAVSAQLAGIDAAWFEGKQLWRNQVLLCTIDSDAAAVGPFEFSAALPGYEPATIKFVALPLPEGLSPTKLSLKPIAKGWGELQLSIIRSSVEESTPSPRKSVWPAAYAVLRRNGEATLRLGIRDLTAAQIGYSDLPWGTYTLSVPFQHNFGRARLGAGFESEVTIGPEAASVAVDLTGLASLELELLDSAGVRWTREVQASLQRSDGGRMSNPFTFFDPPYLFEGLEPGTYRVQVFKPFRRMPAQDGSSGVVELSAGHQAHLTISDS